MLELVDWCHRKAIYLNNQAHEDANPPGEACRPLPTSLTSSQVDWRWAGGPGGKRHPGPHEIAYGSHALTDTWAS